jgi:hypothetical protein
LIFSRIPQERRGQWALDGSIREFLFLGRPIQERKEQRDDSSVKSRTIGDPLMSENDERLREALAKIAEVANEAIQGNGNSENGRHDYGSDRGLSSDMIPCTTKTLPTKLQVKAAETAVRLNPVNAPMYGPAARASRALVLDPLSISVITSRYWGPMQRTLPVSFLESTSAELRKKILSHMNAWTKTASVQFVETHGTGVVRISREPGGYWSYLGTDVLHIAQNRPTMNLEGFSIQTPESEYRRVVRHETGHTLGFPHEHMRKELVARIDPKKAYDFFLKDQGWDKETVNQQVLATLDDATIFGTAPDDTSIMCYQLPGSITFDGKPIPGGIDINETDYEFAGKIYPKATPQQKARRKDRVEEGLGGFYDPEEFVEEAAMPY